MIVIKYCNEFILNYMMWDLVDQLWAYFLNIIEEYSEHKTAKVYFPDQPLEISMQYISDNLILFTADSDPIKKWQLPKDDFFQALLNGAQHFFERIAIVFDKDESRELKKIKVWKTQCEKLLAKLLGG